MNIVAPTESRSVRATATDGANSRNSRYRHRPAPHRGNLVGEGVEESPADTAAVMHSMITSATREILLVGYAIYNGKRLFEPLARRMEEIPGLEVTFCLDIPRQYNDPTPPDEVVARFQREFRVKHWPWDRLPRLFYDPRSLLSGDKRASLHAKCVVVDRARAFVTSANFTDAAQRRNIEAGVDLRHRPTAERIADYFRGLQAMGLLAECHFEPPPSQPV